MVAVDVVHPSEGRSGHTISKGEGGDAIVVVVEEVEGVGGILGLRERGLLVVYSGVTTRGRDVGRWSG